MQKTSSEKEYLTTNFYEAAYCFYRGLNIVGKDEQGPRTKVIIGGHIEELDEQGKTVVLGAQQVAMKYYKSEARKVIDCYKTIKDFAWKEKT